MGYFHETFCKDPFAGSLKSFDPPRGSYLPANISERIIKQIGSCRFWAHVFPVHISQSDFHSAQRKLTLAAQRNCAAASKNMSGSLKSPWLLCLVHGGGRGRRAAPLPCVTFPLFKRDFSRPAPPWGGARPRHAGGGFLQKGSEVFRVEGGESKAVASPLRGKVSQVCSLASAAPSVGRALNGLGLTPSKPRDAALPVPSCCCSKPQAFLFVFLFRLLIQLGRCRRCFSRFHLSAFPCFLLRPDQNSQRRSEGTLEGIFS